MSGHVRTCRLFFSPSASYNHFRNPESESKPLRRTLRMNREGFFMAERRMFNARLLSSDRFLDLSAEAQVLYFHLGLHADDDGFLTRARAICRMIGVGADSLEELVSRGFLLAFESGACVLRHWRQHNSIRKDRYTPTVCRQEIQQLILRADGTYARKEQAEGTPVLGNAEPGMDRSPSVRAEVPQNGSSQAGTDSCRVFPLSINAEKPQGNPLPDEADPCPMLPLPKNAEEPHGNPLPAEADPCPVLPLPINAEEPQGNPLPAGAEPCPVLPLPKTGGRNSIPSLEEVQAYARERESRVSPDIFYNYHEALGWRSQRGKQIVNWKAAFRCWESREEAFAKSFGGKSQPRLPAQDYQQRSYAGEEESVNDMMKRLQKICGER